MTLRSKIAMVVAEFLGTGILATAVINVARSQIGIGYFVAFSAAIAYVLLTLIFNVTSGGHFNPAVTIGMWTIRKIQTLQAITYIIAQMLGGFAAWRLAQYFTGQKLTNIAGKNFEWKILIAEVIGTFVFTLGISAAVHQRYEGGKLAATFGAAVFAGVVIASLASNATINPAVALANQSFSRAYILGPIIGSVIGMNLYKYLFAQRAVEARSIARTNEVAPSTARRVATTSTTTTTTRRKPVAKKKTTVRRKSK